MKKALQQLLLDRQLEMAFQPIWDLREDRVLGYEALVRPPAHYGFSGPEQLFNVAHGSKMAHELDVLCFESIVRSVKVRAVQGFLIARPAIAQTADFNDDALRNRLTSSKLTA